jgi:hypothetical protein
VSEAEDIDLRVVMPSSRKVFAVAVLWLLCICTALVWSPVGLALAQEEEAPSPFLQQDDAPADTDEGPNTEAGQTPADTAEVPAPEQGAIEEPAAEEGGAPPPNAASQADPEVESTGEPTVGGEPAAGGEPAVDTSSDPADPLVASDVSEPVVETPAPGEAEQWSGRLETLLEDMRTLEAESEDADALYLELSSVLRARRSELREALARMGRTFGSFRSGEDGAADLAMVEQLYATLSALYGVRVELLQHVSSELRQRVTGTGPAGMSELRAEIVHLILYGRVQALLIPHVAADWPTQLKHAPLPLVERVLVIIIAMIVFRQWRRWAPGFLRRVRESLAEARPRRHYKLRFARLIWYFDQVRKPLEWLALLTVFFKAVEFEELQDLEKALSSTAHWLLLAWFAVALINAIAARGVAGLSGETAGLRLRSLRLIAAWFVLLGLGLDLAETYLGQATVYEWVWFLFKLLALPLLLVLIAMWRSEIFRQLALEPQVPSWIKGALQHRKGLRSFGSAAIGGAYLIALRLQQQFFRSTSEMDWGRRFQATLYQRELTREAARKSTIDGKPIDETLRARLLKGEGKIFKNVCKKEFERLSALVEQDNVGIAAIVAERGGGKTSFLQRLATEFIDETVLLDCPFGGFEAFHEALAEALGVAQPEPTPSHIRSRVEETGVRVIAVDNFQRLARPAKDGFVDMDRLAAFVRGLEIRVLWVVTVDSAAWNYIRRSRADRIVLLDEFYLPPWTEDQIGNLLDLRCEEVGITPNFGELMLPQQLEAVDVETMSEHNRAGFRRLIWHASGANPAIALRLWANSLVVTEDGEYVVRLAELQSAKELEGLSVAGLLVLRVIAQVDWAAADDIVESLRFSRSEVGNAIAVALRRGWIERSDDRYRISWDWYRTITTVLARRNLLARSTRGGLI